MYEYKIKPATLIRIGLALVFLANSLIAFFSPSEFIELIEKSFVINLLPVSAAVFVIGIGINDALVAALLLLKPKWRFIPMWAALWLVGVLIVRAAPLEILEESGFLFMALALIKNNQTYEP